MKKKEVTLSLGAGLLGFLCGQIYARYLAKKHAKAYVHYFYDLKDFEHDYHNYLKDEKQNTTILLLPSLFDDKNEQEEYLKYFKSLGGFNYFIYPARTSLEPKTILDIENYLISYYGQDHKVLIYGKGSGANTMLNCASLYTLNHTKALLSEGASRSVSLFIKEHLKKRHPFLTPMILSHMIQILKDYYDIDLNDYDTLSYLQHNKIPTCFIHSRYDEHVNINHVYPLFNTCTSLKELFVLKEETCLYEVSQEDDYHLTLKQFIEKYME